MLVLRAIHGREQELAALWKAHPFTQPGPAGNGFLPLSIKTEAVRRRRPMSSTARPLSNLSAHSLVMFVIFLIVWMVFAAITPLNPHGLRVHLVLPGVTTLRSPGVQPVLVRVVRDGRSARVYIDSKPIELQDLGTMLRPELARRPPDWPVYVEGARDLDWHQVAEVIDAARGQHAEVILLTHRERYHEP